MGKHDTGDPTAYSDADEAALEAAADAAWERYASGPDEDGGPEPSGLAVTGQIEWSGSLEPHNDGVRKVNFGAEPLPSRLNLGGVVRALQAARKARGASKRAAGIPRIAKSTSAKVTALSRTAAGRVALDALASPRTVKGWKAGRTPSKANRAGIGAAYQRLVAEPAHARHRERQAAAARGETAARRGVAEALSTALRNAYGVEIRIRRILGFRFTD